MSAMRRVTSSVSASITSASSELRLTCQYSVPSGVRRSPWVSRPSLGRVSSSSLVTRSNTYHSPSLSSPATTRPDQLASTRSSLTEMPQLAFTSVGSYAARQLLGVEVEDHRPPWFHPGPSVIQASDESGENWWQTG